MLRRILSFALILLVLLVPMTLVGCGDSGGSNGSSVEKGDADRAESESDPDALSQLEDQFGEAEWYTNAESIEIVTKLRHPVWQVRYDITVQEVRSTIWMDEIHQALYEIGENSFYLEVFGSDGPAGGSGAGGEESVELPAPPASIDEMAAWMNSAYGPASGDDVEEWYPHIIGYDFEAEAWDGTDVLVVKTDLSDVGYEWSPEREMVDLIRHAVASSAAPWAQNLRVEDSAEQNLVTGDLVPETVPYIGY